MRKILSILFALTLVFSLTACWNKPIETKTCINEMNKNGYSIETELTYKSDKLLKQVIRHTMPYKYLGVSKKEDIEAIVESLSKDYQGILGVTVSNEYTETEAVETLTFNYEELDFYKLDNLSILGVSTDTSSYLKKTINLKLVEKNLINMGFSVKQ